MDLPIALTCLIFFSLTLLLLGVSVSLLGPASRDGDRSCSSMTRILLVCLRLAIGWHFVFEAADKLGNPTWSSEPYLRESVGPLGPYFREMAGDRLVDQLTLGPDKGFPSALEDEWQTYVDALADFYELEPGQKDQVGEISKQAKSKFIAWASEAKQAVEMIGAAPPVVKEDLTMPRRLQIHAELLQAVRVSEEAVATKGKDAFDTVKTAKQNLAKWRSGLKKDLDRQTDLLLKKPLREWLILLALEDLPSDQRSKVDVKDLPHLREKARQQFYALNVSAGKENKPPAWTPRTQKIVSFIIEAQDKGRERTEPGPPPPPKKAGDKQAKEKKIPDTDLLDPLPPQVRPYKPVSQWSPMEWSDQIVKYGLLAVGFCLLAGFMTRLACLGGAFYLFMFFLAMPPMPGWPDPPRAEGHYFLINKNIIEMLALLALATTGSGRWAGLDGLLQFLRPRSWRKRGETDKLDLNCQNPVPTGG